MSRALCAVAGFMAAKSIMSVDKAAFGYGVAALACCVAACIVYGLLERDHE